MAKILIDTDAFADSQIASKIWMCEHLEKFKGFQPYKIWVYGGWYGMMSFLLLSRKQCDISWIRSFDLDPSATKVANHLLNHWEIDKWKFRAVDLDVNEVNWDAHGHPNLVINTSTEHMTMEWWDKLPAGTVVAIQGNNDPIPEDHQNTCETLEVFNTRYPMDLVLYEGERRFVYPDHTFTRFMRIGYK